MAYITSPLLADTSTTIHEDLSDTIAMVDPVSFPLFWLLDQRAVQNITFSWVLDNIPYEPGIQASPEGQQASGLRSGSVAPLGSQFDAYPGVTGSTLSTTNEASYHRIRATNVTHILNKLVSVSRTQQQVNEAGISNEYAHQIFRIGTALMMNMEYNTHWSTYQDGNSGNSPDGFTRRMHGLIPWILSTGLDNSAVTIAGSSIPNNYSSTVYYNPTWYPMQWSATDNLVARTGVTGGGPLGSRFDGTQVVGSEMVNPVNADLLARMRVYATTGTVPNGVYTGGNAGSQTAASETVDLGTGVTYSASNVNVDFSVDLTRDILNTYVLQPAYRKGMRILGSHMLCSAAVKRLFASFAHVYGAGTNPSASLLNTRYIDAVAKRIVDTIDVYESDFGPIFINMDRYFEDSSPYSPLGTNQGFFDASYTNGKRYYITPSKSFVLLEPDMAQIRILHGLGHEPLGKTGDSQEGILTMETSFQMSNPKGFAAGFGVVA